MTANSARLLSYNSLAARMTHNASLRRSMACRCSLSNGRGMVLSDPLFSGIIRLLCSHLTHPLFEVRQADLLAVGHHQLSSPQPGNAAIERLYRLANLLIGVQRFSPANPALAPRPFQPC